MRTSDDGSYLMKARICAHENKDENDEISKDSATAQCDDIGFLLSLRNFFDETSDGGHPRGILANCQIKRDTYMSDNQRNVQTHEEQKMEATKTTLNGALGLHKLVDKQMGFEQAKYISKIVYKEEV